MKVLWVCNIMLPVIAEALHKEASNKEGWLSGLLEQVAAENSSDLELAVAFPVPADTEVPWRLQIAMPREKEDREHLQTNTDAETYNITCYGFHEDTVHPDRYQPLLEEELHRITEEFSPDVIHCFGTEYPHWQYAGCFPTRRRYWWEFRESVRCVRRHILPICRNRRSTRPLSGIW